MPNSQGKPACLIDDSGDAPVPPSQRVSDPVPADLELTGNFFVSVVLPVVLFVHVLMGFVFWKVFEPNPVRNPLPPTVWARSSSNGVVSPPEPPHT